MKASDIRAKTQDQLKQDLLDLRKERFNFRFQKTGGQLENTGRVRLARRDIARIKTVLAEMKSGKAPAAAKPAKAAKAPKAAKAAPKKKETKE